MTDRSDAGDAAADSADARARPRPGPGATRPRPRPAQPLAPPDPDAARAPMSASEDVPVELIDPDDLPQAPPPSAAENGRHRARHAVTAEEPEEPVASSPSLRKRVVDDEGPATAPTDRPDPALARFVAASQPRPEDDLPPAEDPQTSARRLKNRRRRSVAIRTLIVLVVAGVVALLLRAYVVEPYYIPSESMEPTLHGCTGCTEDHVLVDKISYRFQDPHAGDIVVFHKPKDASYLTEDVLIKRVIAVGGDTVSLRKNGKGQYDGRVYVNGLALEESYVNAKCGSRPSLPLTGTTSWKIPSGDLFVMGDNRCDSLDSRRFGPISKDSVIGRAVLIIWPLGRFGGI